MRAGAKKNRKTARAVIMRFSMILAPTYLAHLLENVPAFVRRAAFRVFRLFRKYGLVPPTGDRAFFVARRSAVMKSEHLLPCRVLLVWSLIVALILPVPLGGCVARKQDGVGFVSGASSGRAASASRADVAAVGPEKDADRAGDADRERPRGLDAALFNVAATFMGLPGLAPSSGARDEGLGYHQDGTVRRAGSADTFDGRQARAYMGAGLMGDGAFSSPDGTLLPRRLGDEYSGRRRDYASRGFENFNLMDMALDRGLNYGMGMLNSAGESALSGLVDNGRARLNFQLDRDGRFSGEGDVLLPFRDAPRHTLFTQIGARSMDVSGGEEDGSQRWIGNFGLGHRWFPFAESMEEAGNLMLGWNVFFDNDFSRSHQRGGAGVEAQYDWFHLAANYYTPLSGWKNSRDFDGDFVEERPARGWDARAKAYLPFYRNVALTGSFSQWYGDNVAMYGSSDDLEKDPRVWSYGVEYTPIPLLSAFARQRSTERGKADTEFGLQFTWHFDMPWEEQTSHAKVAELRTVSGSRHEFVDRENRIILEYRAKNAGRIEYLGPVSGQTNAFLFRVTDGFGRAWAGKTVWVRADNVTLAVAPQPSRSLLALAGDVLGGLFGAREAHAATASHSYVTDSQGCFTVRVTSPLSGPVTLHARAGENEQSFTVNVVANATLKMSASSAALTQGTTRRVTFTFTRNGVAQSGLEVRFAANAAFRELAQGAVKKTGSDGTVELALTALTNDTSQTISVEADGQTLTYTFTVEPGNYALTASPSELTQYKETAVVFMLTQGGIPVPKGTKITLSGEGVTFDGKAQYTCVTEDADGAITATVIASQTNASITATVDGEKVDTVELTVDKASYELKVEGTLKLYQKGNITVTLTNDEKNVPDNTSVAYEIHQSTNVLASGTATTKDGQFKVSNITPTSNGAITVTVTVNEEEVSTSFNVDTAVTYRLKADSYELVQHSPKKVIFTLEADDSPVSPDVQVTFTKNSNFTGLPTKVVTTGSNGQITVEELTALTSGTLIVSATVEGQTVKAEFKVDAATYSLEASPATLTLGVETEVTFTLTRNGEALANVEVTLSGKDVTINPADTTTGSNGTFSAMLKATGDSLDKRTITATVGTDTATVDLSVGKATLVLTDSGGDPQFTKNKQTITLTAELTDANGTKITLNDGDVTWTVESSTISPELKAWNRSDRTLYNGLTWGTTAQSATPNEGEKTEKPDGTAPRGPEASLTDIVGQRTVEVKATVKYGEQTYTQTTTVSFGEGPLSVFQKPLSNMTWTEAARTCGGSLPSDPSPGYHSETNLPSKEELQAVSGGGYGAAFAAKWPDDRSGFGWFDYWTGELIDSVSAQIVYLDDGTVGSIRQDGALPVAVCRRGG